MPSEVEQAVRAIQAALDQVPGALIVVVLLGGPTALWFLYRALNASTAQRYVESADDLLWVCPSCRSVNGIGASSCYRCSAVPDDEDLEIITRDPVAPAAAPPPMILPALERGQRPLKAVGPGRRPGSAPGARPASAPGARPGARPVPAPRPTAAPVPVMDAPVARMRAAATGTPDDAGDAAPAAAIDMPPARPPAPTATPPRRIRTTASASAVAPSSTTGGDPTPEPEVAEPPVPVAARTRKGR